MEIFPNQEKYEINSEAIEKLVHRYENFVKEYDNCPHTFNKKWELYGRAEEVKTILAMSGYDVKTLPTYAVEDSGEDGCYGFDSIEEE